MKGNGTHYRVYIFTLMLLALLASLTLQSWKVTAATWYWKPEYIDYVPAGMPDFDQRQWGTYIWQDAGGAWSHCGPVACANSLWWLDSEFEPSPVAPPNINDGFPLVRAYGAWDDHDSRNVQPFVEHLAWLMDTDGRRTGLVHSGTNVLDMQAGLTQYLSWSGVNPLGDVNGDGIVNSTDATIVGAAFGSNPLLPTWNLAADIWPETVTGPGTRDNKVDGQDAMLVANHFGMTGKFFEHTVAAPDYYYIEKEVEKCQDVVLLVGYYMFSGGSWYREPGAHFVTVAGVDSADLKIALSDPVNDAFETGMIPEGRIPFPHAHGPEPPYITHNDARFVSQDIYSVTWISPPFPPLPPLLGNWTILNFASWRPTPPFFAVIEYAVVTSPIPDGAITNVTNSKAGCIWSGPGAGTPSMSTVGQNLTMRVNVTVANRGTSPETFKVRAYANSTQIGVQDVALAGSTSTVVTFSWDTSYTSFAKSNYNISATTDPLPYELNLTNNSMSDGMVLVTLKGDLNGDHKVRVDDILDSANRFGTNRGGPPHPITGFLYSTNADLNDDDKIRIDDIRETASHFGEGPWT